MITSYTVSEVNKFIKQIFSYEQIFYNISIKGEISNFKYHTSGNMFFTLKDENSSIKCVMFKMYADTATILPRDGMLVCVRGDLNVYEKGGTYQVYVTQIEEQGEGLIQKKLDLLYKKLQQEGMFDLNSKVSLIKIPKVVGVITAPDGAALQDVIQILSRRLPILKLKVFPCLVQGEEAIKSIKKAIKVASVDNEVDNLIICRGGGSKEDLNPFDDEDVCRAAYNCKKPIISAIGHETDHCLLDLVADLRAPTPSAAAELVCVDSGVLLKQIDEQEYLIEKYIQILINDSFFKVNALKEKLKYLSPKNYLANLELRINEMEKKLKFLISNNINILENKLDKIYSLLENLSPLKILSKGYCLVFNDEDKIVSSIYKVKVNQNLNLMFINGKLKVKILEKQLNKNQFEG